MKKINLHTSLAGFLISLFLFFSASLAIYCYSRVSEVYSIREFLRNGDWQDPHFLSEALELSFRRTEWTGDLIFPDHYAGYIVCWNRLLIRVTDLEEETFAFYRNTLGEDAPLGFVETEFSNNQLIAIADDFSDYLRREYGVRVSSRYFFNYGSNHIIIQLDTKYGIGAALMESIWSHPHLLPRNLRVVQLGSPWSILRQNPLFCRYLDFEIHFDDYTSSTH